MRFFWTRRWRGAIVRPVSGGRFHMERCILRMAAVAAGLLLAGEPAYGNSSRAAASKLNGMSPMGARAQRALQAIVGSPGRPAARAAAAAEGDEEEEGDDEDSIPDPDLGEELPGGNQGELAVAVDDTGGHIVVGFNDFRGFDKVPISVSG